MKSILFTLVLLMACGAYAQAGISCYAVPVLNKSMCTNSDGTGVMVDLSATSSAATTYPNPADWQHMKDLVAKNEKAELARLDAHARAMQTKTDADIAAIEAKGARDRTAMDIHSKKKCAVSGFTWSHGLCYAD